MNECLSPQHDFAQLEKFINFIASDGNITFQTIDDTGKQRPELRRILHGATETILRTLFRLNQQGAGILAVVNATDGKGRKAENIIHVRAVFCDLDENGKEKLDRIIADDKHPPHAIIESSPGKYHVYWRVDSSVTLDQFTAIQKGLIEKYGADPLVCDLPRAMRVPGLLHNKKEPVLSQIIIMNEEMQPYSVADFAEEIALGFRLANSSRVPATLSSAPANLSSVLALADDLAGIPQGRRNKTAYRTAHRLLRAGFVYEDAKRHVLEMAHNCHPPLPDAEAVGCLNSAKKGRDKEDPIVTELNAYLAKIMAGSSCCILWEEKDPVTGQVTAIHLYKPEDLRVWFSDRVVTVVKMGRERDINILDYWLKHTKHRKYVKLAFAPGQKLPDDVYNLWQGPAVKPNANGSCQLFLDHILENIADGSHEKNDYLLNWMADAVQNPTERPGVANVLQGDQGVGKSVFADQFGKLFGHYYVQINSSRELTGNFNAHLEGKLLVFYDEASCTGDRQVAAKLRAMITEETLPIERKGRDMFYVDNYIRLILASNDDAVIPAGAEERRYFATHVGKKHQGDRSYFKAIIDQMETGGREHLMHLLLNRDLTGIDLGVFPKTVTLFENKLANMEPVFKWWYEKLVSPADEWQSVVGKDCLYQSYLSYCNDTGERQRLDKSTFGKKLKKLLPSVNESRETEQERKLRLQKGGSNLTRKWQYVFPSQRECRCSFEAWVKQSIEWDAD